MSRRFALAALSAVLLVVTTACSGVPKSSAPEIVTPVRVASSSVQETISPARGADPQAIVNSFLFANGSTDDRHSAARSFLTPDAQRRWSDSSVTLVDDNDLARLSETGDDSVTVSAMRVGSIDQDGVYTPDLFGNGASGDPLTFTFGMRQISGQWRIDQLQNGLIITRSAFTTYYPQYRLYFYDLAESRLVPDIRYTSIADRPTLATWVLTQLANGPRPELQNAVATELPQQSDPTRVRVTMSGSQDTVDLPGAAQLDTRTRSLLAAQIALTLDQAGSNSSFTITDGGRRVAVADHPAGFTASDFSAITALTAASSRTLFYVSGGVIVDDRGVPVPGAAAKIPHTVTSAALAARGSANYYVAADVGPDPAQHLLIGRAADDTLRDSGLAGSLTAPAWLPGAGDPEVWVGVESTTPGGPLVWRLPGPGSTAASAQVMLTARSGSVTGRIGAIEFSIDGVRVAFVVTTTGSDGNASTSQVWVGSVVRSGTQVRVDGLQPVTPPAVQVTDVAWNDATTLYVTGTDQQAGNSGIWSLQYDGALWAPRSTDGLTSAATTITATLDAFPVVSAGGRIWQQHSSWVPLFGTGAAGVVGTAPSYLQ